MISKATEKNWQKLRTDSQGKLVSRANKRCSTKKIEPTEYVSNVDNLGIIRDLVTQINVPIPSAIFSLGINLLKKANLYNKNHVLTTLKEYKDISINKYLTQVSLPDDEHDILGVVYQMLLTEGEKNIMGSYYTPKSVVTNMVKNFSFSNNETFLDPCCGSGIFLTTVSVKHPSQVFGIDKDHIAVLIAKINLLLKYRKISFTPQVYNWDFLNKSILHKFDYIATNPPWGSKIEAGKESFSLIFKKSFSLLTQKGIIKFLFPEAILNVRSHKNIRKFMLDNGLTSIYLYDGLFSGVVTKYVDIECRNNCKVDSFLLNNKQVIPINSISKSVNYVFNFLNAKDLAIIKKVKTKGIYSLDNSIWGLGIVTGDNKSKLYKEFSKGMEKIYTGKEIQPYSLKPAKNYIYYTRNELQQVAKEEIYRASEKLVYKFISKKLIFSYDNSASLFLNSANILIPSIPNMSIKTVAAFLNSPLFQFIYLKLFGEIKILKGNLLQIRFPKISSSLDKKISNLVDKVLKGNIAEVKTIEKIIFSVYGLTKNEIQYIQDIVN